MLILTLILACEPETIREGDAEEVDLSGYATLEDLAALQAELDEQASLITALTSALDEVRQPEVLIQDGCPLASEGNSYAVIEFPEVVRVLNVSLCVDQDFETYTSRYCYVYPDAVSWFGITTYSDEYDGALTDITVICDTPSNSIEVSYVLVE